MNLMGNKYLPATRYSSNKELLGLESRYFIYFLIKDGLIVYIGATKNIQQRICAHKSLLHVSKWFTHFRIISCNSNEEMMVYEKRWIARFNPIENVRHKKINLLNPL